MGVFEQKGSGDTSAAPSLSSIVASEQLSAGHKETGLNIALPVCFPHFIRGQVYCGMILLPLVLSVKCHM